MKLLRLTAFLLIASWLVSCGTQKKTAINYIDNTDSTVLNDTVKITEIKIQKNDLLSIQVYSSSLDPAVDAPFNLGGASATNTAIPTHSTP